MSQNNTSNNGRTFWDVVAEHPKISGSLIIFLIILVIIMVLNGYSLKTNLMTLEPSKKEENTGVTKAEKDKEIKKDTVKPSISFQQPKTPIKSAITIKSQTEQKIDSVKPQPIVNITSTNQSGGITAQNVNIGVKPQQRALNFALKKQLFEFLTDKNEIIDISSVAGDSEAYKFSLETVDFLKRNGYSNVNGVNQAFFSPPIIGQSIQRRNNQVYISIGSQ
jgi:hypothetical protein